jgi:hypothetical protein
MSDHAEPSWQSLLGTAPGSPDAVRLAERFLQLVERIAEANAGRRIEMTERYFNRMVRREAEHQLMFEEYLRQQGLTASDASAPRPRTPLREP